MHASVTTAWPTLSAACSPLPDRPTWSASATWTPGTGPPTSRRRAFGYQLLWVLVVSNLMAILLQTLSAPAWASSPGATWRRPAAKRIRAGLQLLWMLCEIAIAACDLAEVLGAAIGLNLLFHIPLTAGVLLTALDTLLVLWLTRYGIRLVEAIILALIADRDRMLPGRDLVFAKPVLARNGRPGWCRGSNDASLYVAIGILGATVMPHNLYLHSALVQTRRMGRTSRKSATACRYNLIDSVHRAERRVDRQRRHPGAGRGGVFQERHGGHRDPAGATTAGSAAGNGVRQRSVRDRAAGQRPIVDAHRNLRRPDRHGRVPQSAPASLAAAPDDPVGRDHSRGDHGLLLRRTGHVPTADPEPGDPEHAAALRRHSSDPLHQRPRAAWASSPIALWVQTLAWSARGCDLGLNLWLVGQEVVPWMEQGGWHRWLGAADVPRCSDCWDGFRAAPFRPAPSEVARPGAAVAADLPVPVYRRILVPLDHSDRDRAAVAHAAAMARLHGATIHLLHVEEGVTSQLFGAMASTARGPARRRVSRCRTRPIASIPSTCGGTCTARR